MSTLRKKLYTQAYFLLDQNKLNSEKTFKHSFSKRMKYVGMNGLFAGYCFVRYYFNTLRLEVAFR
jgi:hypothetical protein